MPTYRVYLGRPEVKPPVYSFCQTVVAPNQPIAVGRAYQTWYLESSDVPPLSACHVSVREIGQTNLLALGSVASGQQAFAEALQKKAGDFLGTKLDGKFNTVAYPAGFNYGITYGPNAYWNKATLSDFDTLLSTASNGQLELSGGNFSTLYHQVLGAVSFVFSSTDQKTMNDQDTAASAQIASILTEFQNAGGTYNSPLPFGGKLQDVFNQLNKQYGSLDKLPNTLNALRNAIASYQAIAAQSYALHNRFYEATDRLKAAQSNVKTPTQENGGQQTDTNTWYVGYTPDKLPTANQLIGGLKTDHNAVQISLTMSKFSSKSTNVSVSGGIGLTIPIEDVVTLNFGGSASYDLSTYTSSSSNVTMDLTYKGVTLAPAMPSNLSTDNSTGWYAPQILAEIIANHGKDATGYQLQGSEFNIGQLFGEGGALSRLKTFVISQPPEIVMTFTDCQSSRIASDFKIGASASVDLFGFFRVGSASASYQVQNVHSDAANGSVTVTFGAPKPSGTTPIEKQIAYVMGGVASYPPNHT